MTWTLPVPFGLCCELVPSAQLQAYMRGCESTRGCMSINKGMSKGPVLIMFC